MCGTFATGGDADSGALEALAGGGRRERKKLQTHYALIDAALDLFEKQGFEATTVEQITDAVDVSRRTFNRYFTSKEDVVLAFFATLRDAMVTLMERQPPEVPVLDAMRGAFLELFDHLREGRNERFFARLVRMLLLVRSSPTLSGGNLEQGRVKGEVLAGVIARRMGVDPAVDLRPRFAVAAWESALRLALDTTTEDCVAPDFDTYVRAIHTAFSLTEHGINYPAAPEGTEAGTEPPPSGS